MSDFPFQTLGATTSGESVEALLLHALEVMRQSPSGTRPVPVCIWGQHGIGKTELVRGLANRLEIPLVYIAPAQFEEMGDLIGMPRIDGASTRFAPPSWVPQQDGPGILLIDDVNRADDRILRGLMQLFQYYEMVSWALPNRWLIVMTANPDGGDYSVTPMDEAMLNRMLHITMRFDAGIWAKWAASAGVDERGIHFVMTYPELVNRRRTTPRSLVQFFDQIRIFDDFEAALPMIKLLGEASLDQETVQAFIAFIHLKLDRLPSPQEILDSTDISRTLRQLKQLVQDGAGQRLDILSVIVTRLTQWLLQYHHQLTAGRLDALTTVLTADLLPNDLRLSMAQELTQSGHSTLLKLYSIPAIAELLLKKM